MRKRTVSSFFDNFLWFIVYIMPIFITVLSIVINGTIHTGDFTFNFNFLTLLEENLTSLGLTNSLTYTTFIELFGSNSGILPLFNSNLILLYFSYFVNCIILHVAVDILALIPRVAHKLLDKVVK